MSRRSKKRTGAGRSAGPATVSVSAPSRSLHHSASRWNQRWILGALLILATTIAYQKAWHAGYIWDDDVYVTANKLLTAPDGLRRIWFSLDSPSQYFPLVYTTFRLEHALWGLDPAGYHWVNILLHVANALLVWRLLRILQVPGAWLAAALFALHPVHVESVAWITERKNVLMGFFFLLSLLSWIAFVDERRSGRWKFYVLALLCYALALFSKTTACTLPAAMLLILWLQKKSINWRRLLEIAPFVALGIGMGLVTIWWERYHQGTRGEAFALGLADRILVASRAPWFYAGKLLWPAHLSFSYPKWPISAANPLDYLWLLATAGAGAAIYFLRRHVGRSVEVAMVFFVATLSPVLGFIMLYTFRFSFVADHYQYLASIGPLALAASGITIAVGSAEKRKRFLLPVVCAGLLLSLGALTWRQCAMYANEETLWQKTIAENADSWMAYTNLGTALLRAGRTDDAITQFKKALEIHDDYALAHNNLGNALLRLGRVDESLAHLQKALEINPNYAEAQNNLGNTLVQMSRWEEAAAHYTRALEIDPRYAEAHNNLGALFLQLGRVNESFVHLQKALEIDPDQSDAHSNLGNTLLKMGRIDEAVAHYDRALEINPSNINAQNNLAWLLATSAETRIRNGAKAVELAERADRLTGGGNPVISATLAAAYAETGRFADAVTIAERALRLATNSHNTALADGIRQQIELYRSNSPSRDNHSGPASH
jgi:tetratricopeptide (TPR) repeat protein